jgi:hypothetical protein
LVFSLAVILVIFDSSFGAVDVFPAWAQQVYRYHRYCFQLFLVFAIFQFHSFGDFYKKSFGFIKLMESDAIE